MSWGLPYWCCSDVICIFGEVGGGWWMREEARLRLPSPFSHSSSHRLSYRTDKHGIQCQTLRFPVTESHVSTRVMRLLNRVKIFLCTVSSVFVGADWPLHTAVRAVGFGIAQHPGTSSKPFTVALEYPSIPREHLAWALLGVAGFRSTLLKSKAVPPVTVSQKLSSPILRELQETASCQDQSSVCLHTRGPQTLGFLRDD